MKKWVAMFFMVNALTAFAHADNADPCAGKEWEFEQESLTFFRDHGYPIEKFDVGNGTTTLSGSRLYTLRGYYISSTGNVSALMRIGECNAATGRYEHLQFSASGASLYNCSEKP